MFRFLIKSIWNLTIEHPSRKSHRKPPPSSPLLHLKPAHRKNNLRTFFTGNQPRSRSARCDNDDGVLQWRPDPTPSFPATQSVKHHSFRQQDTSTEGQCALNLCSQKSSSRSSSLASRCCGEDIAKETFKLTGNNKTFDDEIE
ncbi:hypothetical protein QVD17_28713 [Tagetes erecta]|uniref:Uncharacterized protein n=1 Tax=Tagetes erecta TaxID=13708 RepID=A0AAD8NSD2_TARER|nr:hypothetical protein QVD17_28713 [Tagetes erecta]